MKLHEDPEILSELVAATAEQIGLPEVYIEKDYWVTKALKHLSESDLYEDVVFKGGTSLSKAYRIIDRFSEDIDLAIFSNDRTNNQIKRTLRKVESIAASGLSHKEDDPRLTKGSTYRKTVYAYPRQSDNRDFGQASPELLIEVNCFTNPEPFEERTLQSYIAEVLSKSERDDLISRYALEPFTIRVLSVKRTLIEKVLGIVKDSYDTDPVSQLSNRIRHLYDITMILRANEMLEFLGSEDFSKLLADCIKDECDLFPDRTHLFEKPLQEAPIFNKFTEWKPSLTTTYEGTFKDLVYGDKPDMNEIHQALTKIRSHL